jgi:hypothetical protein
MTTRFETDAGAGDAPSVGNSLRAGALWGLIAAIVMAMYAMVAAATYQGTGFFTPLYHIASTFIDPKPMMASMENAGQDHLFYFEFGPALVGMMVHLIVGAAYGAIFALIARPLRLRGSGAVVGGAVYGILAMAASSLVGLPIAASLFGGGEPISAMPSMVGWSTFTVEHLIFGAIVGIGYSVASRNEGLVSRPVARAA